MENTLVANENTISQVSNVSTISNEVKEILTSKLLAFNKAAIEASYEDAANSKKGMKTKTYNALVEALTLIGVTSDNIDVTIDRLISTIDSEKATDWKVSSSTAPVFEGMEEWVESTMPTLVDKAKKSTRIANAVKGYLSALERQRAEPESRHKKGAVTRTFNTVTMRFIEELNLTFEAQRASVLEAMLSDATYMARFAAKEKTEVMVEEVEVEQVA